ncbi:hypothetical protein KJ840_02520 [Patescibacteria group bacterium]|nr:hypothetical protein [Patescibacteria group bacterium]
MKNFFLVSLLFITFLISGCILKTAIQTNQQQSTNQSKNWQTFSDPIVGFILKYPANVELKDINDLLQDNNLTITVSSNKIELLDSPLGFNKETALKDREALSKGEYGYRWVDLPIEDSMSVVKIGNKYGKSFTVFGRFEVCDVTFERRLVFYNNDYQIVITLRGAKDGIISSMPEYFDFDEDNCFDIMVWNRKEDEQIQNKFYQTLLNNNSLPAAQEWFDTFDEIIKTIEIY